MAIIIITSKDNNLFTKTIGVLTADFTRNYHAKETTGGYVRAEMIGTERSDLFNPIHFSEIEIDGVVGVDANETVSLLNAVIYNLGGSGSGSSATDTAILEEIRDSYDVETEVICIKDDPQNYVSGLIKKAFFKKNGEEDLTKRVFTVNGVPLATPPTSFTYGVCGSEGLKEFNFSVTPIDLIDNTDETYTTPLIGVLETDQYVIVLTNPITNVEAYLESWIDDQVIVKIYNNTGVNLNTQLDFILKQV